MPLTAAATQLLEAMAARGGPDITQMGPAEIAAHRPLTNQSWIPAHLLPPLPEGFTIEDRAIPSVGPGATIPIRVYRPAGTEPKPGILFFHGGGFVVCGLDSHHPLALALAIETGAVLISVDYRMAPEDKFPAASDDCLAATRYVAAHSAEFGVDATRLAVAGDSAGGNLAAVTALRLRDEGGPRLRHQVLIYPVTDLAMKSASIDLLADGPFLTKAMMQWFREQYLRGSEDIRDPIASPLYAEQLDDLPEATVITAEYDPLRDEGEAYAARLAAAGVPTLLQRVPGMFHGFASMIGMLPETREFIVAAGERLRAAFAR